MKKRTTDSESGLFRKEEHKRQFAYKADIGCDKNSFVPEAVVTPGNLPDRVAFDEIYDKVTENYPQVAAVLAGAAYKTPRICKKAVDNGHAFSTAYKRPHGTKGGHAWWKYGYAAFCFLRFTFLFFPPYRFKARSAPARRLRPLID